MSRVSRVTRAGLALAIVFASCASDKGPTASLRELATPGNFTNGRDAAGALASVAARAIAQGRTCERTHGAASVRCETLGVLASWSQVSAVDVARCGRAHAEDARRTLLALIDDVDAADNGKLASTPTVPPTPDCR
jgi:hypothetical protein